MRHVRKNYVCIYLLFWVSISMNLVLSLLFIFFGDNRVFFISKQKLFSSTLPIKHLWSVVHFPDLTADSVFTTLIKKKYRTVYYIFLSLR